MNSLVISETMSEPIVFKRDMGDRSRNTAGRRSAIQRRLLLEGTVTVDALSRDLSVSEATVRRDLKILSETASIRRTHGGAVVDAPQGADQAFAVREQLDAQAKRMIARRALTFVDADQTLFMNDGSTVLALARELVARRVAATVVTPGVNIATYLSENPAMAVYLLGGRVRHRTLGTSGGFSEEMLAAINADVAFIAAEGVSVREGLTFSYESDARLARLMSARAATTIVLATARKLDQRDRFTALAAPSIDVVITDCVDREKLRSFSDAGMEVVACNERDASPESMDRLPPMNDSREMSVGGIDPGGTIG